jgi:hypothetical protein
MMKLPSGEKVLHRSIKMPTDVRQFMEDKEEELISTALYNTLNPEVILQRASGRDGSVGSPGMAYAEDVTERRDRKEAKRAEAEALRSDSREKLKRGRFGKKGMSLSPEEIKRLKQRDLKAGMARIKAAPPEFEKLKSRKFPEDVMQTLDNTNKRIDSLDAEERARKRAKGEKKLKSKSFKSKRGSKSGDKDILAMLDKKLAAAEQQDAKDKFMAKYKAAMKKESKSTSIKTLKSFIKENLKSNPKLAEMLLRIFS